MIKKVEDLMDLTLREVLEEYVVCDDVDQHYQYFKNNYNHNPNDCCNLTIKKEE